ncbi:MAG: hypothetical protein U0V87_08135 [Acidobacteriota bacterium]
MRSVLMLVDYKGDFYSSRRLPYVSMDIPRLREEFRRLDVELDIRSFTDLEFRDSSLTGRPVLYQSSEDHHLHYKSFIEDMVLGLTLANAFVIPKYEYLRAHHNKVFLEVLRDLLPIPELKTISGRTFGTLEEFRSRAASLKYPVVIKPSAGATSSGVTLATDRTTAVAAARRISRTFYPVDGAKEIVKSLIRSYHKRRSHHRHKFVAQEFVAGLKGDFKVLVYGEKYFVLSRRNRDNDFRASGSGKFQFNKELPEGLLDTCRRIYVALDVPFLSIDIAGSAGHFAAFEWQFLSFGNYTLEQSPFHFTHDRGAWSCVDGRVVLEAEFATSVTSYVERKLGVRW